MNSRFGLIVAALLIGFTGIFLFTKDKDQTATNNSTAQPTSYKVGAGNKKVVLTEYGDLECPACAQYYPILKEVKNKFGDDITFQFRHFPLVQIHKNAMIAHRAAQAAGNQGKFFEMHDLMYESQPQWAGTPNASQTFEGFAAQLGLDLVRFKADVTSQATNDIINADIKEGQKLGATSTPTFVINGKKVEQNPRDLESFNKLIEDAIAEANKTQ